MIQKTILILILSLSFLLCKKEESNDDLTIATLGVIAASGFCNGTLATTGVTVSKTTATIDSSSGCVTGVTTCMDSALPAWIKDNFKCSTAYVSGNSYIFKSQNVPNTKSYYYGSTSPLFEALPGGNTPAGNNSVSSQKITYSIPSTPTQGTGKVGTQSGYVSIGITVNGLAIFNNAANPPDTLAVEALTFDNFGGHPQNTGVYHHHASVSKVSNNDANLIGIILDGYALYGKKCDSGTAATGDDFTPVLDSLHGHTAVTVHFSTPTYHYHFAPDATAGIDTLMGSFFYGTVGSVSN
ncbi:YHYH protein [Leptospira sp. 201903070]|uniref:YHYH protein n=1 Tax=Leptospira ainlahdjerensis TaxID=2810033 RepID=A0ABS2U7D5_9LEPT|nr:YHYH protein [Leptospira ainlahdjerensis]MBM9576280.1 YHYH protein [Leptospira ainlahdjerensis]